MKLRMLHTRLGCADGYVVRCYQQGHIYEIDSVLAEIFLRWRCAERILSEYPNMEIKQ